MMRSNWLALLVIPVIAISVGTACKKREPKLDSSLGTVKSIPEEKDDNEWPLYKVPAEGFTISLPTAWRQLDMTPASFEKMMQTTIKQNPQLEPVMGNLRQQMAAGVKFFGFDESSIKTGSLTNISVIRVTNTIVVSLDEVVTLNLKEFDKIQTITKPIPHSRVKTAAGDGERFNFKMPVIDLKGNSISVALTMYVYVKGKDNYNVTMTCLSDREAEYKTVFEKIGQSFRLTNEDTSKPSAQKPPVSPRGTNR